MKIKKILYDGNKQDWQLSIRETRRVIDLLENDPKLESFVKKTRAKYKIPKNGYPFEMSSPTNEWIEKYSTSALFDDEGEAIFENCQLFIKQMGLPYYWWSSVAYFVLYNVFFTPERVPLSFYHEEDNERSKYGLHVVVKEQLGKSELKKYIDYSWDEIQAKMRKLPKRPKGHNFLRPELAKEIYDLRENKGLTFKKIADILYEKNEDKPYVDIFNEDYIKTLYHRWKKIISKSPRSS